MASRRLFGFGGGFVTVPLISLLVTAAWGAQSDVGGQAMHIAVATSALVMLCAALLHLASSSQWNAVLASSADDVRGIALGIARALLALSANGRWDSLAVRQLSAGDHSRLLFSSGFYGPWRPTFCAGCRARR